MKNYIFLAVLIFFASGSAHAALYNPKIELAYSGAHYCARIDDSSTELLCWSDSNFGEGNVPPLTGLSSFDVGYYHSCALDREGLKCWGQRSGGYTESFAKIRPIQVSTGYEQACVLDASSVTCAGFRRDSKVKVFDNLKNPKMMSASSNAVCVIDDLGLHCYGTWGTPYNENRNQRTSAIPVPELKNPVYVSNSTDRICALDDEGLKCWDFNQACELSSSWPKPNLYTCYGSTGRGIPKGGENWPVEPGFIQPTKISVFENQSCVLDQGKSRCWTCEQKESVFAPHHWQECGRKESRPLVEVSHGDSFQFGIGELANPGISPICTVEEEGLKCPLYRRSMPAKLKAFRPTKEDLSFPLERFASFLKVVAIASSPIKAQVMAQLETVFRSELASRERSAELNLSRFLFLKLSEAILLSGDSPYYLEKVIPAYLRSVAEIEAELNIHGIAGIPASAMNRRVVLKVAQTVVSTATEVMTPTDREVVSGLLRTLGQAIESPMDAEKIRLVIAELKRASPVMEKFKTGPRTAFFPQILQAALQWLEGNS